MTFEADYYPQCFFATVDYGVEMLSFNNGPINGDGITHKRLSRG